MSTWIAMRSYNDAWIVGETLDAIARQDAPHRLLVLDNASSDGTAEMARERADAFVHVPKGEYVPGRVLNQAMRATDGEFVAFLNSDCVPQDHRWLSSLLAAFDGPEVAAVFGRQVPRPECRALFAKDTEDTFGDGARQKHWRHCFSMASSAVRRSDWEESPFREDIQYSEDVDWTWRRRQAGRAIRYARDSVAMHSHNYTLRQFHRRQYGEGKADAAIFDWQHWEAGLLRYSLLPFARQVLSDARYGLRTGRLDALVHTVPLRTAQMLGRRKGFVEGLKEKAA